MTSLVETVAREIAAAVFNQSDSGTPPKWSDWRDEARASILAVAERCALEAESWQSSLRPGSEDRLNGHKEAAREIGAKIRAMAAAAVAED